MNHRKKTGITVIISIFVCLIGLVSSIGGSLRYGMRDREIENLAEEWELSQMQITKIASYMSMAQFLVVMMENPEITAEGTEKLLDAEYTREFISEKLKNYRNDLLKGNGEGRIAFTELETLYGDYEETITQDLQYHIDDSDLEMYEMIWDNLAITERSDLAYYQNERPVLFALLRVFLSGWFLIGSALLIAGAGTGLWYLRGRSFGGYGILGVMLAVVGIVDCMIAALRDSMISTVNRIVDMRSNLMTLVLTPVCHILSIVGVVFVILGIAAIVCRVFLKSE